MFSHMYGTSRLHIFLRRCVLGWNWTTSIPFPSINPYYSPKDQSLKFLQKNIYNFAVLKNSVLKNLVFLSWRFWIFAFFCFFPLKISQRFLGSKDESKFCWLSRFPAQNNTYTKKCVNIGIFMQGNMYHFLWPIDFNGFALILIYHPTA